MLTSLAAPTSLTSAIAFFADPDQALRFMVQMRWPNGASCPHCEGRDTSFLTTRRIWKCKGCKRQFSVKVGTIFEDSPLGLDKWLPALWMLANCKNGISSYELARALGVTQKSAWFMLHRIRAAMASESFDKVGFTPLKGEVEIDETFIGGKGKNMHASKKKRVLGGKRGRPIGSKTAVLGMLQRTTDDGPSQIQAQVVDTVKRRELQHVAANSIEVGSTVYTDAFHSYRTLNTLFKHGYVDHRVRYVLGQIHTNGLENFWSLLKRTIRGTYVSIDPFHVGKYVDEQAFRFNARKGTDGERFKSLLRNVIGKRLTYEELTGANLAPATT